MRRPANTQRRALRLADVAQIMPEVRRLVPAHHTVGNWSLGQICRHLVASVIGSMEGFDLRNHRVKRFFIRRKMLEVALTKGIPPGWTVDPNLTPPSYVNLDEVVEALAGAIERYQRHKGKLHAHPLFGELSGEVWDQVHCVHCAHHLSFAVPD